MSNILIIKHGSLGDIVQISGVLRDIRDNHKTDKIFILTTMPYVEILSRCPYIDGVIVDKRSPRWNILYLIKLKKMLNKYNFSRAYDLQNSSRTTFYRKYLLNILDWNCTKTALKKDQKKKDFDKEAVIKRFRVQLESSKIKTRYTLIPDFSWAAINVNRIVNKFFGKNFILIFPFCSPQLPQKKWPYFNDLIKIIKSKHINLEIAIAPGPDEIEEAKKVQAVSITNNNKSLNITELTGLILKASFVIANDTGPAHIAAHVGKSGVALFGYHTTAEKVSIETEKFKAITEKDLNNLSADRVYSLIKDRLNLIN